MTTSARLSRSDSRCGNMSTKGLIRTLEAVIAVLLLLSLLFFILPEEQAPTGEIPAQVKTAQDFVLEEIALNKTYRDCITVANAGYHGNCQAGCLSQVQQFMLSNAPFGYTVACEVCDTALSCANLPLPTEKSIYTDSIFISRQPVTKVLRVYYYEK